MTIDRIVVSPTKTLKKKVCGYIQIKFNKTIRLQSELL
jgi:hypothetical protein